MRCRFFIGTSKLVLATGVLILTSCSTPQTRISDHPDLYQSLSHRDQALVTQGQIRISMSRTAVWLAWGSPDQKIVGNMGGGPTETWVYIYYATYPYYPPYGPWGPWAFFGDPFYDPFFYSYIPPSIPLSWRGGHFRQGQSCVLPVPGVALEADRKFCRIVPCNGRAFLRV